MSSNNSIREQLRKIDSTFATKISESKNVDDGSLSNSELAILDPNDPMYERHVQVLSHVKKNNPDLFKKMQNLE